MLYFFGRHLLLICMLVLFKYPIINGSANSEVD